LYFVVVRGNRENSGKSSKVPENPVYRRAPDAKQCFFCFAPMASIAAWSQRCEKARLLKESEKKRRFKKKKFILLSMISDIHAILIRS